MTKRMSVTGRSELVALLSKRYATGSAETKCQILDEFVAVTGFHRKHAIRVLRLKPAEEGKLKKTRPRRYGNAVAEALLILWEASDRVCGKRLKALLPILLDALEKHGHLNLDVLVRAQLLSVSAATIDRLLVTARNAGISDRRRRRGATNALRRSIPIRTFADWSDPEPGFVEADLVSHSGPNASGSFAQTLTVTDVASGWIECVALVVRDGSLVTEALTKLRKVMPFRLRGFDTDNGGEFMNDIVISYCRDNAIEQTRSRPYRKNDQAWVEQKNGSVVRRLVGYRRLEGLAAVAVLGRLYEVGRLFVNFFQPSFKLASKTRVGAKVTKRYKVPATPCSRLLESPAISDEIKIKLRAVAAVLDPLRLLAEIRSMQQHLAELSVGECPRSTVASDPELQTFLTSLRTAWKAGEVRPTHASAPTPLRDWRTRTDPFELAWPLVRRWLEAEPDRNAKDLFKRLQEEQQGIFPNNQLRTLQRRVQQWRRDEVRRLLGASNGSNPTHDFAAPFG